jgi:hypothetical protein
MATAIGKGSAKIRHPRGGEGHLVEKDVVQLEVPVDDAVAVQEENPNRDLSRVEPRQELRTRKGRQILLFYLQRLSSGVLDITYTAAGSLVLPGGGHLDLTRPQAP